MDLSFWNRKCDGDQKVFFYAQLTLDVGIDDATPQNVSLFSASSHLHPMSEMAGSAPRAKMMPCVAITRIPSPVLKVYL